MKKQFKLRDADEVMPGKRYRFLGADVEMKIDEDGRREIWISAQTYINEVISTYEENKQGTLINQNAPAVPKTHLELDESRQLSQTEQRDFQRIMGIINYLKRDRADIQGAWLELSQFCARATENHYKVAEKILGYLKSEPSAATVLTCNTSGPLEHPKAARVGKKQISMEELRSRMQEGVFGAAAEETIPFYEIFPEIDITVYYDANFGKHTTTGRSNAALAVYLGGDFLYQKVLRQQAVYTASFGSEIGSGRSGALEGLALRQIMRGLAVKVSTPAALWGDNMSVLTQDVVNASAMKCRALLISYNFIRWAFAAGIITPGYIPTDQNIADWGTKALGRKKHYDTLRKVMSNLQNDIHAHENKDQRNNKIVRKQKRQNP